MQHVEHNVAGIAYPVTADPFWIPVSGAAMVGMAAIVRYAFAACGLGYLSNSAQQVFFNGWVWKEVQRAGREGCVWGMLTGPFGLLAKKFIRR